MINQEMIADAEYFLQFARDAREDFHEPDEQGLKYNGIVGTKLDNACGNSVRAEAVAKGYQEVVIYVEKQFGDGDWSYYQFNLANIFALARIGAIAIVEG